MNVKIGLSTENWVVGQLAGASDLEITQAIEVAKTVRKDTAYF